MHACVCVRDRLEWLLGGMEGHVSGTVRVCLRCVRVCDCAALMSQKRLSEAEASSKAAAAAVVSVDRM